MVHLIMWLPLPYQFTLGRALAGAYPGAFTAWFAEASHPDYPHRELPEHDFPVRFLDREGYMALFRALRRDRESVVILGGWRSPMSLPVFAMTTLLRIPFYVWSDHPHPRKRGRWFEWLRTRLLRLVARRAAGILAMGEPTRRHLIALGMPADKVINFPAFAEIPVDWTLPPAAGDPERSLHALAIGRLTAVKCFDVAIRAIADAEAEGCRIELTFVGEGPERDALQALSDGLGCAERVHFRGWLEAPDVRRSIAECDVLVVPSSFEGYGIVVLEAMAAGRPVLASNVLVAACDRADDSGAVQFHNVGDHQALAVQMCRFANDPQLLLEAARASRAIALQWPPERAADILDLSFGKLSRCPRRHVPTPAAPVLGKPLVDVSTN